jgi:hypothetical protein
MPIRSAPWDALSLEHVQALIDRQIPESRTLDYKETLRLDDSGRLDFLQDVTAMANASGGTILYGVAEGDGEDRGLPVRYRGMPIEPEGVGSQLDHLLRDGVDERIHHVQHRAIPVGDGTYLYVVRIPPSPRAPHMIIKKSGRPRFYSRATVSNDPMNMQQIREAILRSDTLVEQARHLIETRTTESIAFAESRQNRGDPRDDSVALLHVVPLYRADSQLDLADQVVADRMRQVLGYGAHYQGNLRWSLEGLYSQYESDGVTRKHWALLTRTGAMEFGEVGFLMPSRWHTPNVVHLVETGYLDQDVRRCIAQVRGLAEDGWLTVPFVLSLRLLNVFGAMLGSNQTPKFGNTRPFGQQHLIVEPEVVTEWTGVDAAARRIFDTVWQAFGYQRCPYYAADGTRLADSPGRFA